MAPKRSRTPDAIPPQITKKTKTIDEVDNPQKPRKRSDNSIYEISGIVATAHAGAEVDANPPLEQLNKARTQHKRDVQRSASETEAVVYWMRMEDMRIVDNRALEGASNRAKELSIPTLVLFVFSPSDYRAHDRSPRRIDFVLRNLVLLKNSLAEIHIPLHMITLPQRKQIPQEVVDRLRQWKVKDLFANIEYPVDELRRDLKLLELATAAGIRCDLYHDRCLLPPGHVLTKNGKMSTVYTPWMKQWTSLIQSQPSSLKEAKSPEANDPSIHQHQVFQALFHTPVPDSIPGFECDDLDKMTELWPAGTDAGMQVLERFLSTKARTSQVGDRSVLEPGQEEVTLKNTRVGMYEDQRVRIDMDSSSRISPYLATGAICARQCVRKVMEIEGIGKFDTSKGSGPGVWIQEIGWRDFYTHILVAYPRVSMGRPFLEKYAGILWEEDADGATFQAWKDGKTGYPIVDAAMRQCNSQGYMHNRARMIAAMFLTKDLMLDWRLGERHFMESFIDGDLASNNGGWQWCASTGTDAQPYFRIFNPLLQAEKADPNGDYIRHFVPELKHLKGKALHDPYHNMPKEAFRKLGYPEPIVDHKFARERAIRRFKNVGEE